MTTTQRTRIDLLSVCVNSFDQLLQAVNTDNRAWKRLAEDIDRYSLLEIKVPRKVDNTVPTIEPDKLNDRSYRLKLAKELRKPIPADFWTTKIPLDRDRLSDREYRIKMASILGYALYKRLGFDTAPIETKCTLMHLNATLLAEILRRTPRYSSASSVSRHIMSKFAQEEITKLLGDQLDSAFIEVEEQALADLDRRFAAMAEDTQRRFAEITRRTNERCDRLLKKINA